MDSIESVSFAQSLIAAAANGDSFEPLIRETFKIPKALPAGAEGQPLSPVEERIVAAAAKQIAYFAEDAIPVMTALAATSGRKETVGPAVRARGRPMRKRVRRRTEKR